MKQQRPHPSSQRAASLRRLGVGAAATVALALVLSSNGRPLQDGGADVDGTRALLEKYVQVRSMISAERRDWSLERGLLENRVELVQLEIQQYRDRVAEIEGTIGESDRKREDQLALNAELKQTSAGLEAIVAELEAETRALVARLPEPVANQVALLSQQIPSDPDQTELALGRRFQNLIGVLNQVNRFNREISVFSELVVNATGEEIEATTMHVGLGRAFYVSGESAGVGPASAEPGAPWEWEPRNDSLEAIAKAIAVMKNETPAAFVRLPIPVEIPTE